MIELSMGYFKQTWWTCLGVRMEKKNQYARIDKLYKQKIGNCDNQN